MQEEQANNNNFNPLQQPQQQQIPISPQQHMLQSFIEQNNLQQQMTQPSPYQSLQQPNQLQQIQQNPYGPQQFNSSHLQAQFQNINLNAPQPLQYPNFNLNAPYLPPNQSPQQQQNFNAPYYNQQMNIVPQPYNNNFFPPQPTNFTNNLKQKIPKDEDFIEQSSSNKQLAKSFDIRNSLKIQVKAKQKCLKLNSEQSQCIPAMVSIHTDDLDDNYLENSRPGVDLICLIDDSGSMSGIKIKLVQDTLRKLLTFLSPKDRLCLIAFDYNALLLTDFLTVSPGNQNHFDDAIKYLQGRGGTTISSGMRLALTKLRDRKYQNSVNSIFLLSDGQDNQATVQVNSLIEENKNLNFSLHSFGFGDDHDGNMMSSICKLKNGNFYFVQNIDTLDECFVDAFGGLISVVGINAKLQVECNPISPFQDIFIKKTYSNYWTGQGAKLCQAAIPQITSGVSKDLVFEIEVPQMSLKDLADYQRNVEIITVNFEMKDVNSEEIIRVQKKLIFTIYLNNEEMNQFDEDDDVVVNYLRVKGAQVIEDANKQCQNGQYQKGADMIRGFLENINGCKNTQQQRLASISNDLDQAQILCNPQIYQKSSQQMYQIANAHLNQQSQPVQFNQQLFCQPQIPLPQSQIQTQQAQNSNQMLASLSYQNKVQLAFQIQIQTQKLSSSQQGQQPLP